MSQKKMTISSYSRLQRHFEFSTSSKPNGGSFEIFPASHSTCISGFHKPANPARSGLLGGSGDLVSRLITPITHIVTPFVRLLRPLTESP